jgi:hypothetical protein
MEIVNATPNIITMGSIHVYRATHHARPAMGQHQMIVFLAIQRHAFLVIRYANLVMEEHLWTALNALPKQEL